MRTCVYSVEGTLQWSEEQVGVWSRWYDNSLAPSANSECWGYFVSINCFYFSYTARLIYNKQNYSGYVSQLYP